MHNLTRKILIGLLAGTPYPAMDEKIHPGYQAGAHHVDPDVEVLFAAVGDWNNPNRARDLALNMFNRGATAIMSITGGGDSGVHRAAAETDAYAVAVNTNQNALQPGVILASVLKRLDNSIYSVVERAMAGGLPYGTVETAGVAEGAISLAEDELYAEHVPAEVRERMTAIVAGMRDGDRTGEALGHELEALGGGAARHQQRQEEDRRCEADVGSFRFAHAGTIFHRGARGCSEFRGRPRISWITCRRGGARQRPRRLRLPPGLVIA